MNALPSFAHSDACPCYYEDDDAETTPCGCGAREAQALLSELLSQWDAAVQIAQELRAMDGFDAEALRYWGGRLLAALGMTG